MNVNTRVGILRGLLVTGIVAWGASLGLAQTTSVSPAKSPVEVQRQFPPAPAHKWIKDPNQLMPMRQMTNAQRRAAAARNAQRRNAAAQRTRKAPANSGVQQ